MDSRWQALRIAKGLKFQSNFTTVIHSLMTWIHSPICIPCLAPIFSFGLSCPSFYCLSTLENNKEMEWEMENYCVGKACLSKCEFSIHLEIFYRIVEYTQISPQANITEIAPG